MVDKLFFLIKPCQIDLLNYKQSHSFVFSEYEMNAGRIYNLTKISYEIDHYLNQNDLFHKSGILIFDNSLTTEQLTLGQEQHIDLASHMHVKINLNQNYHYQAVLSPGMLLQYQLLFAQIGIYIELFTSAMIFDIQYLLHLTKKDLSAVDSLAKLQEAANNLDLDLHTKFIQALETI